MFSVEGSRELQAAVLALKAADRDLRRNINAAQRQTMGPVWVATVRKHAGSGMTARVLTAGARLQAGNPPQLVAANSKRKVGRALIPSEHWAGFEYGAARSAFSRYQRTSPRGTGHGVERRTMRHLRGRNKTGYVLGPAVAEIGPRMAAQFAQLTVRMYMDAINPR